MKKMFSVSLILLVFSFQLLLPNEVKAQLVGGLSSDTITIRIFGIPQEFSGALNVKLSFSNPEVVKLDSSPPLFMALGVNQLLTESDPESSTISVVWDGIILNNEAKITAMLTPGRITGVTNISVEKVEVGGGFDITDRVAIQTDKVAISNSLGSVVSSLGEFTLLEPPKLVSPGRGVISFEASEVPYNIVAKLNGENVDFINPHLGVAVVDLPDNGGNLPIILEVSTGRQTKVIRLGTVHVESLGGIGFPPQIKKALAANDLAGTQIRIEGDEFGVLRFGKKM